MNQQHLEAVQLVASLDFTPIRRRLLQKEGWNEQRVDAAERGYREFLSLAKANPGESLVPTEEVDEFWHYHILDTPKYLEDCLLIFGYFFHHDPNLEKGSEDLTRLFARTEALRGAALSVFPKPSACTGNGGACAGRCRSKRTTPAICGSSNTGTNCTGKQSAQT